MMLWFAATLIMALTVAAAVWPLVFARRVTSGTSETVYRSQLQEIDREENAGLLPAEDARMARTEVQRRLIATTRNSDPIEDTGMTLTDRTTFIAVAALLAIGSALLYGTLGTPGVGSAANDDGFSAAIDAKLRGGAGGDASGNVAPVDEMISNLEARLQQQPEDAEGWRMLGWSKFRTDDFAGAAKAYSEAVRLAPGDAETQAAYGEALARASNGLVTPEAADVLARALKLDPFNARARFLLGLRKEQSGASAAAIDDWLALLKDAKPEDDWYDDVRGRILELSEASGVDVKDRIPPPRGGVGDSQAGSGGPTASDIDQADALSPEDRQAMIEGMVSRLDERLKDDPKDLDGWLRLIRARRVLGQQDLADRALASGSATFAGNSDALDQLKRSATEPLASP
jgi:cytochrome c-type biogenesis protein CcmH